jgi:membrane-bound lytic murein transglycosylase B
MRSLAAAICFSLLWAATVSAQQPAPPPSANEPAPPATAPASPPPASAPATEPPSSAAPAAKGNFAECRKMARQNKVPRDQRKDFMKDCTQDIMADCRDKAKEQKLRKAERRDFIRECTGRPARKAKD